MGVMHRKVHRGWFVFFGCVIYLGICSGALMNCLSVFYPNMCDEFSLTNSQFASFHSIRTISSALAIVPITKIMFKVGIGKMMCLQIAMMCLSTGAIASCGNDTQLFVVASLMGISQSILAIPVPVLLTNWFKKYCGTVTGLALASSGLVGIVGNPFFNWLIEQFGWRASLWGICLALLLLVIPIYLAIPFDDPAKCGDLPYGWSEETQEDVEVQQWQTRRAPAIFVLCILCACSYATISAYTNYLTLYSQWRGFPAVLGAQIVSISMIGNLSTKVIMGRLVDRFGISYALYMIMGTITLSMFMLSFAGLPLYLTYAAVICFGTVSAMNMFAPSLVCKFAYSEGGYLEFIGKFTATATFINSVYSFVVGKLLDASGGDYTIIFRVGFVICMIAILSFFLLQQFTRTFIKRDKQLQCKQG